MPRISRANRKNLEHAPGRKERRAKLGTTVSKLHFAANHNDLTSVNQTEICDFITPKTSEISVLLGLARMLGCKDIAAVAHLSESTDWIPVYFGNLSV